MGERPDEIAAAVAGWVGSRPPERHPSAEQLAAYAAGERKGGEGERVEAHLVVCRDCASLVLDLVELGGGEAATASAAEVEGVLAGIAATTAGAAAAGAPRPEPAARPALAPPPARREVGARWPLALAASLLAATVGLSAWVATLRRTVGELSRPALNVAVVDLRPADSRDRGEGGEVREVEQGPATLILEPGGVPPAGAATVEIARRDGGVVFRGGGLLPNPFGSYTLALPPRLPPGEYRLRLAAGEGAPPFAEFSVRVTPRKGGGDG